MPLNPRPELIQAMRTQESGGVQDPRLARGAAGELGRMQVLPQTAAMYGVTPEQLKANPALADKVGERYYTDLLRRYHGNEFLALVAYNSGPGRVDRGQLLPQSVRYATAILKRAPGSMLGGAAQQPTPQAQAGAPGQMPLQLSQNVPGGDQLAQQAQAPGMLSRAYQAAAEVSPEIAALGKLGTRLGETGQEAQARYQRFAAQSPEQQTRYDPQEAAGLKDVAIGAAGGIEAPEAEVPHPAVGLLRAADDLGALITGRQQQQQPEARLQQILKGQGPESMYGPLRAPPPEAMQAGEAYSPREMKAMENIAMGGLGVEGEIPELSSAARAMVRRARQFGVDPADIGPLAQRVREGTLTERGLSQALKNLRGELPQTAKTAAMIRGAAEDIPRDVLGAISRAVREGDLTAQQAKKMLKAVTGGAALLPLIGAERQEPTAVPTAAQPGQPPQLTPPGPQAQPGILQRMGQSLRGGLEGTAYAAPFDFSAFPGAGTAAAPAPSGAVAPAAAPSGPRPGVTVNPMTGNVSMGQPSAPLPSVDPTERTQTITLSPTGGASLHITTRTKPPSQQEQQQYDASMDALARTMDALKYWDAHIGPRMAKGEFKGMPWTGGGWKRIRQNLAYKWPLEFGAFETYPDPQIDFFFSKLGPLQAEQLRSNVGGRLGIGIASFLGPHIPDPNRMDLNTIKRRLDGLRANIPIYLQTFRELHQKGWTQDQIGDFLAGIKVEDPDAPAKMPALPASPPPLSAPSLPAEAKDWKTSQGVKYLMEGYGMSHDEAVAWIRAHPEFH